MSRIQKGPTHPFERVESRVGGRNGRARGGRRECKIEREKTKTYLFVERGTYEGVISARYLHVFSIRSRSSRSTRRSREASLPYSLTTVIDEAFSSRRLYPVRDERTLSPSLLGTVTLPWLTDSEAGPPYLFRRFSFVRYFSSGTLVRQSYSPALRSRSPVSFNLAALYRNSFTAIFLCLRYSVLPPRHARLESVLRREFTRSPGIVTAVVRLCISSAS